MAVAARLPEGSASHAIELGPFEVSAGEDAVARFAAASRSVPGCVPATFPIAWLAHRAIRAAIEAAAEPGEFAFHEEQTFDYHARLTLGGAYELRADLMRLSSPPRLSLTAHVAQHGTDVLTMRTILRLVRPHDTASHDAPRDVASQQ